MIDRYGFHLENVEGQDAQSILEAFVLEYYGGTPGTPPEVLVPQEIAETEALSEFLTRAPRLAGRRPSAAARREAAPRRARDRERAARARGGHRDSRGRALEAGRSARGASRGAQPREPAAADRVLRRLEHPGRVDRRVDDRVRRRQGRGTRTTGRSRSAGSRDRTTSVRCAKPCRAASRGCGAAR